MFCALLFSYAPRDALTRFAQARNVLFRVRGAERAAAVNDVDIFEQERELEQLIAQFHVAECWIVHIVRTLERLFFVVRELRHRHRTAAHDIGGMTGAARENSFRRERALDRLARQRAELREARINFVFILHQVRQQSFRREH